MNNLIRLNFIKNPSFCALVCLIFNVVLYGVFKFNPDFNLLNVFCLISILFFQLIFFINSPVLFTVSSFLNLWYSRAIIATYLIENGWYVFELQRRGSPNGATILLSIFFFALFASLTFFCKIETLQKEYKRISSKISIVILIFSGIFIIIAIVNLVFFGVPLLSGEDRIIYWRDHPVPTIERIIARASLLLLFLGIMLRDYYQRYKIKLLILILVILALVILHGNKFTYIFNCLYYLLLGLVVNNNYLIRNKKKILKILLYIFIFLFLSTIIFYALSAGKISDRLPGDGALWWGIVELYQTNDVGFYREITNEFQFFLTIKPDEELNVGMLKLMGEIAPDGLYYAFLEQGRGFSFGYPAILVYYSGLFIPFLIQFFWGFLYVVFFYNLCEAINVKKILKILVLEKLYVLLLIPVFIGGGIFMLLDLRVITLYLLLIILNFYYKKRNQLGMKT